MTINEKNIGICIHWSGVGCTYPDPAAATNGLGLEQDPGYYDHDCPRKQGAGCTENGYLDVIEVV